MSFRGKNEREIPTSVMEQREMDGISPRKLVEMTQKPEYQQNLVTIQ